VVVVGRVTVMVVVVVRPVATKFAVIVPGPLMVAVVELEVLLSNAIDAPPLDQLENSYPPLGAAEIGSP
jgi:hypothetical protein